MFEERLMYEMEKLDLLESYLNAKSNAELFALMLDKKAVIVLNSGEFIVEYEDIAVTSDLLLVARFGLEDLDTLYVDWDNSFYA